MTQDQDAMRAQLAELAMIPLLTGVLGEPDELKSTALRCPDGHALTVSLARWGAVVVAGLDHEGERDVTVIRGRDAAETSAHMEEVLQDLAMMAAFAGPSNTQQDLLVF